MAIASSLHTNMGGTNNSPALFHILGVNWLFIKCIQNIQQILSLDLSGISSFIAFQAICTKLSETNASNCLLYELSNKIVFSQA